LIKPVKTGFSNDKRGEACTIVCMKILDTQFVQGVVNETAVLYDGTPHIAFIGRSNVGKSSTLNAVTGKRRMVKVGQTPGKTKEINFFKTRVLNDDESQGHIYLVDLPGYGYAKVSKDKRNQLKDLIDWYITNPEVDLELICLIIDAKVGLTDLDIAMIQTIQKRNRNMVLAVNKIDKLNQKSLSQLKKDLLEHFLPEQVVYYSAETKKHVDKLLEKTIYSVKAKV